MAAVLGSFLADWCRRPWQWGERDCLLFLADWIERKRGVDLGAPWRGTYSTSGGARQAIRAAGGMESLLSDAFGRAGLRKAAEPSAGDVGVVAAPFARRHGRALWRDTGAICVGPGQWAMAAPKGLVIAGPPDIRLVAAWSL